MKRIEMHEYGKLREAQSERPEISDTQLLIEVRVNAVNSGDRMIVSGEMRTALPLPLPYVPGMEFAGIVRAVGSRVTAFREGDRVIGLNPSGGGYADYAVLEETHAAAIPENLAFGGTVSLAAAGLSARQALYRFGELRPGSRVLIEAAAGAVGHLAVQLAKLQGAYVAAAARSVHHEFLRAIGADETIEPDEYRDRSSLRHSDPFDLALGMIRESRLQTAPGSGEPQAAKLLADGGIYVSLLSPQIEQTSSARGIRFRFARVRPDVGDWNELLAQTSQGRLKIHTAAEFPFTAQGIEQAYRDGERGKRGQYLIVR
ncbi:hypothetical protein CDO73_02220 [Saccharibacillus sp. O23]|uniref:NADP-dependent oxidoreductase n=1 Tax=Saccharibacillus sp. O23 TaxID=2009338 RepID=UPI000B4E506F|nr:NADP-dependent oxidoreductase [Saccharibacillus sp. O23]OWR32442.1 hypothetical protein CDO73_02220 [Saccharibacillus sp. O23]